MRRFDKVMGLDGTRVCGIGIRVKIAIARMFVIEILERDLDAYDAEGSMRFHV